MPIGPALPPGFAKSEVDEEIGPAIPTNSSDIGPTLPSHLVRSRNDDDLIGPSIPGPAMPPSLKADVTSNAIDPALPKRNSPVQKRKTSSDDEIKNKKIRVEGPTIPIDSDSDEDFGPALPGPAIKGPSLPPQFREMLAKQNPLYQENADLEKYSRPISQIMAEANAKEYEDEPAVGPSLPVGDIDYDEIERQNIINRAEKMKAKLEGKGEKELKRESWMTELPDFRTGVKLQAQTQFRKTARDDSGRDEWTKTPNGNQASAKQKKIEDRQKVLNLAEWERDQKQREKMKTLKRNQESMLSTHMKKMESEEKKSTGPKERVAFDHKRDMQGSIIDDAKRKAMLKSNMGLNNKFAAGKFL